MAARSPVAVALGGQGSEQERRYRRSSYGLTTRPRRTIHSASAARPSRSRASAARNTACTTMPRPAPGCRRGRPSPPGATRRRAGPAPIRRPRGPPQDRPTGPDPRNGRRRSPPTMQPEAGAAWEQQARRRRRDPTRGARRTRLSARWPERPAGRAKGPATTRRGGRPRGGTRGRPRARGRPCDESGSQSPPLRLNQAHSLRQPDRACHRTVGVQPWRTDVLRPGLSELFDSRHHDFHVPGQVSAPRADRGRFRGRPGGNRDIHRLAGASP